MNPKNFFAELKRRNVYKVAIAYIVGGWALSQGIAQVFPVFDVPNWAIRAIVLLIVLGLPIALVLAWMFEITPGGLKRTEAADAMPAARRQKNHVWIYIVVIGAAISIALFFLGRYSAGNKTAAASPDQSLTKSIAVLPFVDMSQAKNQEYFCDGISEEILDTLAKVEGLRVVARTSSFSFKGKNADVSEIAQKLNVQNVLEGSLRREGNRIRITAQLVDARNGFHLWSDTFDRELQGVFAAQDEITHAIVDALKVKLALAPSTRPPQNTEAYDLYLQGLYLSNKSDEQSLRKALTFFQQSLDKDPNFARAWTGIAKVWAWLADAYVKPVEALPKVKEAALKAIALDERQAEAHIHLSGVKGVLDWNPTGEQAELERALELDPNSAYARTSLGFLRYREGRVDDELPLALDAKKLDPLSPIVSNMLAFAYLHAGRFDEAIAEGERTLQLDPTYVYGYPVASAYREKGDFERAVTLYASAQRAGFSPNGGLAITYARMGRKIEARRILDQLVQEAETRYIAADSIAGVYVALGENEQAFHWLNRAYAEHSALLGTIGPSYLFRPLRSDPRFAELLRRMGFDPMRVLHQQKNP